MRTKSHNRSKARIIRALRTRLLAWFDKNKRDLPWRRTRDPYAHLVSEIMLQQTRVTTVIPYYERWMKTFPTVRSLARAKIDKVLHLWAGLGYYSRARNLHKAAQVIVTEHGGKLPSDVLALQQLPGVGRYTAGAIASIAFEKPAPILDGNVIRVLSRLFFVTEDTTRSEVRDRLWQLAGEIIPSQRPGDFNESLMELGALVCLPGQPVCELCPMSRECLARSRGRADDLPRLKQRKPVREVTQHAVVLEREGRVVLRQRQDGELMAGLWGFPRFESATAAHGCYAGCESKRLGDVVHSVMDRRITVKAILISANSHEPRLDPNCKWIPLGRLRSIALPSADRKLASLLHSRPGHGYTNRK